MSEIEDELADVADMLTPDSDDTTMRGKSPAARAALRRASANGAKQRKGRIGSMMCRSDPHRADANLRKF